VTTQNNEHQLSHRPVLLDSVVEMLSPKVGETYLDLTAGYGGHATAVVSATKSFDKAVLIDRDPDAIKHLRSLFGPGQSSNILHLSYEEGVQRLLALKRRFDMILMDLGVSTPQLDSPERGFSFQKVGPLDMRMNPDSSPSAADLVNTYTQDQLAKVLRDFGEENQANAISKAIVQQRPIETTTQLAKIVEGIKRKRSKLHPATRSFQAIRIAVNDELGQLERTLPKLVELLNPGGRLVIISFHSLEDRLVKRYLLEESRAGYEARLNLLTKKPIRGDLEDVFNGRARSAKLRAAVKK